MRRWGEELTVEYFSALDEAAKKLANNTKTFRTREELTGGTGLQLFPFREHFLVYEPLNERQIMIVAVLRQSQDIPRILSKGSFVIVKELESLRAQLRSS